jgi:acid phosphatase type 7
MRTSVALLVLWLASVSAATEPTQRLRFNPAELASPPSGDRSFRFVVMSDMNSSYGSTEYNPTVHNSVGLVTQIVRPELVVSAGDLVAGQKRGLTDEQVYAMWDGFARAVTTPLREEGIPFAPVPGNHDASGYPAFAREREIYQEVWRRDDRQPALDFIDDTQFPLYYTFRHKGAFFMALDVTTLEPLSEQQWAWMEQQLAAAKEAPLRIVMCHVPPYPVAIGREKEIIPAPDNDRLRELFVEHGVDVFFTGHHHAYFKGRKQGLNLVSLNACGNGPRSLIGTQHPQPQSFLVVDVMDGQLQDLFAVQYDGAIFDDASLPLRLVYEQYELPRFDQQ